MAVRRGRHEARTPDDPAAARPPRPAAFPAPPAVLASAARSGPVSRRWSSPAPCGKRSHDQARSVPGRLRPGVFQARQHAPAAFCARPRARPQSRSTRAPSRDRSRSGSLPGGTRGRGPAALRRPGAAASTRRVRACTDGRAWLRHPADPSPPCGRVPRPVPPRRRASAVRRPSLARSSTTAAG